MMHPGFLMNHTPRSYNAPWISNESHPRSYNAPWISDESHPRSYNASWISNESHPRSYNAPWISNESHPRSYNASWISNECSAWILDFTCPCIIICISCEQLILHMLPGWEHIGECSTGAVIQHKSTFHPIHTSRKDGLSKREDS